MSDRRWFETMATVEDTCEHGETCNICRQRIELGRICREYLRREDTGEGSMLRCITEWARRTQSLPNLN
jgi:hypothetical protein